MLVSPHSRLDFINCLADFLELRVDVDGNGVRLRIPRQFDDDNPDTYLTPNVFDMQPDGTPRPVGYELRD
jgi:hypothetical protein